MSQSSEYVSALEDIKSKMIVCASMPIVFDGFSQETFDAIAKDAGIEPVVARSAFPKGISDLAVELHKHGDGLFVEELSREVLGDLRYSEKVAYAVFKRLMIAGRDKELVRKASAYFALPQNAALGTQCIWHTADTIWSTLGDTSDDVNWYSKRAILSGVYSSSLLYWLGDESEAQIATKEFIDRRITNVMQFEKAKSEIKSWKIYEAFRKGPGRFIDTIKAPQSSGLNDMPGQWRK